MISHKKGLSEGSDGGQLQKNLLVEHNKGREEKLNLMMSHQRDLNKGSDGGQEVQTNPLAEHTAGREVGLKAQKVCQIDLTTGRGRWRVQENLQTQAITKMEGHGNHTAGQKLQKSLQLGHSKGGERNLRIDGLLQG